MQPPVVLYLRNMDSITRLRVCMPEHTARLFSTVIELFQNDSSVLSFCSVFDRLFSVLCTHMTLLNE